MKKQPAVLVVKLRRRKKVAKRKGRWR